ncbi:MAG: hypothetical protein EG825_17810, partial [Rhodocyclaceae bacterium]|nr:hypothetical protein [Rhodocyclaceae bacterium]
MKATARKSNLARIITILVVVLLVAAAGLAAVRLIGGQPLGIRHWVDVQVWHARSFVSALSDSRDVKSLNQGKVTNVVFLHHSVGDNLLEQTDLRDQLGQAGLSLWDHDYNYYGLTGADGQPSGYNSVSYTH